MRVLLLITLLFACSTSFAQEWKQLPGPYAVRSSGVAEDLAMGTIRSVEDIDALIVKYSDNWRIERMPVVDRNILRLGIYEMSKMATPSAVVIDQALELARRFAGDESVGFLNGVLDAVNHAIRPEVKPSPTS